MDKIEARAVIKYLTKKGMQPKEIYDDMHGVYGDQCCSIRTVERWFREFKHGRCSLVDDPREGAPSTAVNDKNIKRVNDMVMEDRRITYAEIQQTLDISPGSVKTILHEHLHLNKCLTQWVSRMLTPGMRANRVECCQELLALFDSSPTDFATRVVTGDETWIHHYDPETQAEARQWKHAESPAQKRPRMKPSVGKIMMTVFWDSKGVLMTDFLEHKKTVTAVYYADLIRRLHDAVKEKRRGMLSRGVLLLHDNASSHKARLSQAAIRESGFEEPNHPPYSPDVAPSDFYLFSKLKKDFCGKSFEDDAELKSAVNEWFESQTENFYETGILALRDRYARVCDLEGEYIE